MDDTVAILGAIPSTIVSHAALHVMTEHVAEPRHVLAAITRAWRTLHPEEMTGHLHPDITMALPSFQGSVRGREKLIESFKEFCTNARVLEYEEKDDSLDVVGNVAVASFRFSMVYERAAYRARSTGRDLWVFERHGDRWIAVWRTMSDLQEERLRQP